MYGLTKIANISTFEGIEYACALIYLVKLGLRKDLMIIDMKNYSIAGLNISMHFGGKTLTAQAKPYEAKDDTKDADIVINPTVETILSMLKRHPEADADLCEYMWTGTKFYEGLLDFDGFLLHSSAVVLDGKAYLFSATSGTGKSTHTNLWLKVFGDRAKILNDDKPAIRVIDGQVYASGTPWSGKVDLSINETVPVAGICFLERAKENSICEISSKEALTRLLEQTIKPKNTEQLDKLCKILDRVFEKVKVYRLGCNISEEAVYTAYNAMKG